MPYDKNSEAPDSVKVLPAGGITIWRKAFNAALEQYGDEETAVKVAWAAVKKTYEKKDDKWVLKEGEEEPVQEEVLPRSVLITHSGPLKVLEEKQDAGIKTFRVRGVALVDDVVSANGYYYSRAANDAILKETVAYINGGGKSTVYSRHEKARYGLPVGRVERLERVGNEVHYEARIADTTEGKDVQVLITEGVLGPTSIRSSDFETKPVKIDGRQVMAVTRAIIHGIDLVEQASIAGAGITQILTEGSVIEEVRTDMDWKAISFDELKTNRPDLLEAYDAAKYNGVNDKVRKLEAELEAEKARSKALEEGHAAEVAKAVEDAKAPLLEQVQALTAETEQRKFDEAISGAVKGKPYAELLESALRSGMVFGQAKVEPCAKAEDVTEDRVKAAETLVESMKQALLVEKVLDGGSSFRGSVQQEDSHLTPAQTSVLELAK